MTNDIPLAAFANKVKELTEQGFEFEDLGNFVNGDTYAFLSYQNNVYCYVISSKKCGIRISFETAAVKVNHANWLGGPRHSLTP